MTTKALATVTGTMLAPGVSRNNRLYTQATIGRAVERMRTRLSDPDGLPIVMRTHHDAGDDSRQIVGRIVSVDQDEGGRATYAAELYDNSAGRDIAALVTPDKPALRSVSIHGYWIGTVDRFRQGGAMLETADDLEIDAVDFTASPGVTGATLTAAAYAGESVDGRVPIHESVNATITAAAVVEDAVASLTWVGERYNPTQLRRLAAAGHAMVDDQGRVSYPIDTKTDLRNAIRAVGEGGADHDNIRAHITCRARALGLPSMIPANWNKDGTMTESTPAQPAVTEAYITVCVGGDQGNIVQVCVDGAGPDTLKKAAKKAAKIAAKFLNDDSGDGTFNVSVDPAAPGGDDLDSTETVNVTMGGRRLSEAETRAFLARIPTETPGPTPEPARAVNTAEHDTQPKETAVAETTTPAADTAAPTRTLTEADLSALGAALGTAVKEAVAALAPKTDKPGKKNRKETSESTESTPAEGKQKAGKDKGVKETITPQVLEAKLAEERTKTVAAVRNQLIAEGNLPSRKGFRHVGETDDGADLTGDDLWNRRKEIFASVAPALYAGTEVGDAGRHAAPEVPAAA